MNCVNCHKELRKKYRAVLYSPVGNNEGFDFNHLLSFDPASYTLADFRTQHRIAETTLGSVTGAELKDIWTRWGPTHELLSVPEIAFDCLDDETEYRLHIPMDLYIKLGQRQKNLSDPKPGPAFAAEELIPRIFAPRVNILPLSTVGVHRGPAG